MGRTAIVIINGNYKFSINNKFEVEAWEINKDENTEAPFLRQPGFPGGADFCCFEEAQEWANEHLTKMQTPVEEAPVEPTL